MNGLDFAKVVRGRPEFNAMRIIMVTTETEMKRMADAPEHGVDEYVMKPVTRDAITQKREQSEIQIA